MAEYPSQLLMAEYLNQVRMAEYLNQLRMAGYLNQLRMSEYLNQVRMAEYLNQLRMGFNWIADARSRVSQLGDPCRLRQQSLSQTGLVTGTSCVFALGAASRL